MRLAWLHHVEYAFKSCGLSVEQYQDWSDEQVVNRLLQLLKEKPDEFISLAWALGECRALQAVEPLSLELNSSNDYRVRATAKALGKIGDASVVEMLRPLLSHREKRVRVETAGALTRLGQADGLETLRRLMKEREAWTESFVLRSFSEVDCAQILYECGDPSGMGLLVKYLDHPDMFGRLAALQALGEIKAPECAQAVRARLAKERDADLVRLCVCVLAELGDFSELQRIVDILTTGSDKNRYSAAEACGRLGLPAFLEPLRKRLSAEGNERVRQAIQRAIHRIEESPVVTEREAPALEAVKEPLELIAQLGKKLLRNPWDEKAWNRKAEEEIYYFTAQLKKGGDRGEALCRLGFACLFKGRRPEAEEYFQQALAENADDPIALFGLARCEMHRARYNEDVKAKLLRAEAAVTKPIFDLYDWPGNDLYLWIGRCYFEMHEPTKAIEYLEKAIEVNNDVITGHTFLGRAFLAVGQLDQALQALQRETEFNPRDYEPHLYLAAVYQVLGQHRQTQQHLEQADKLRVHPVRLTPRVQAEIRAQVMRAQAMQRTVSKKKRWRFWKM